jgi:hypothetical protein
MMLCECNSPFGSAIASAAAIRTLFKWTLADPAAVSPQLVGELPPIATAPRSPVCSPTSRQG